VNTPFDSNYSYPVYRQTDKTNRQTNKRRCKQNPHQRWRGN